MKKSSKSVITTIITIAILAALTAVLDTFAVIGFPSGVLGVSSFYIGSAFFLLFVYLFKWKGAIAIYIGLMMSSLISSGFSFFPLYGAWGNVVSAVFIVLIMHLTKRNCEIKNWKDFAVLACTFIIAPAISAAWVIGGWVVVGIMPADGFIAAFIPWALGGIIVYFVVGTPVMKFLAPLVKRFNIS